MLVKPSLNWMQAKQLLIIAILFLSAAGASLALERNLGGDSLLRGSDAYYYALQAEYFAKTGAVKIPDSSLVHQVTGRLRKAGMSAENTLRIWQSVSLFLFFAAMFALLRWWNRELPFWASLLLVYLGISPSLLFMAIEFPKFFSMALILPFWFWALNPGRKNAWLAIALLPLTCLFHRAALPLAGVFGFSWLLIYAQKTFRFRVRTWLAFAAVLTLLALLVLFLPDRFRLIDLQRLAWETPRVGIFALLGRGQLPFAIKMELILMPALALGLAWRHWKMRPLRRGMLLPIFSLWLPAFFPFGGEEVFGVGERYAILLPALALMACLVLLAEEESPAWSTWRLLALAGFASLPIVGAHARLEAAHPRAIDPDFASYRQVSEELGDEEIPMLIAHKGLVFFYKYRWLREAFPYEPERHWDKTRIWRLAYGITPDEFFHHLPNTCTWDSGFLKALAAPGYILIREDCWFQFREKLSKLEDPDLYERAWESSFNPAKSRPAFLYPKHSQDKDEEFPALPRK